MPWLTSVCVLNLVLTAPAMEGIVVRHDTAGMSEAGALRTTQNDDAGPNSERGSEPQRFLPGVVSTPEAIEHGAVVSPDGRELWFTRAVGIWGEPAERQMIYLARRLDDGTFAKPEPAPFSGKHLDDDPFPSPDGHWIYFVSDRPAPGKSGDGLDLWRVRRLASGWGEPEHLASVSSPGYDSSPVVTSNGDLWFSSTRDGGLGSGDLWRSRSDGNGAFGTPENLGAVVNSAGGEWNLLVSPDAKWLIFEASGRAENITRSGDLYLSRHEDGGWSDPVNLRCVNSPGSDLLPRQGTEGQLLFASSREIGGRQTDIFTVRLETVLSHCADTNSAPLPRLLSADDRDRRE